MKVTGTISQGVVTGSISQTRASGSMALLNPGGILTESGVSHDYTTIIYGLLYNWHAATDIRYIAASGWRVPNRDDFSTLMRYIDNNGTTLDNDAGGYLKEAGVTYWQTPNSGANNAYLFNARGAGLRSGISGSYGSIMQNSSFWTLDELDSVTAYIGQLLYTSVIFSVSYLTYSISTQKDRGLSIRLIKDSTTLTHGQSGTYIGNDSNIYRTICIGTQEWIAGNLVETKYRNGDDIPEITDNTTWANLTTGALCAYNNDWDNV